MKSALRVKDKTNPTEGIKIAPFRKHIRKTVPHKHNNYFEVIYLTQGEGTHTIDGKAYEIVPPIIFTIRKEQVHFWDIETEPDGFVLLIKKTFIENCLDKGIKQLISNLSAETCLFPQDNTAVDIFKLLYAEFQIKKPSKQLIVEGLLKALLAKLLESAPPKHHQGINRSVFQSFIDLLNQENKLTNKVSYYANLLHTTPQNLNAICRKERHQSATEVISEHIIGEAKRLLLYTDFTVSEISTQLDFKDNSHFTKYFKRHTTLTPNQFRKTE